MSRNNPDDPYADLPPLRDVIAAHHLVAEKKLGQNFLLDSNITDKIARCAGDLSGLSVFEIGPGPGGLTRSLLRTLARDVIAIEFDTRAIAALQDLKTRAGSRLQLIQGDAAAINLEPLAPPPRAIVANLPYNIATTLLIGWLQAIRARGAFQSMTLMFQKEVAERIVAQPGTKPYGRLSVIAQWLCEVKKVYDLPPGAFTPPPKVSSAVVHFVPRALGADAPAFDSVGAITAAAFGQRRKMVRSSLKDYTPYLMEAGIEPDKRAENLNVAEFIKLAQLAFTQA